MADPTWQIQYGGLNILTCSDLVQNQYLKDLGSKNHDFSVAFPKFVSSEPKNIEFLFRFQKLIPYFKVYF